MPKKRKRRDASGGKKRRAVRRSSQQAERAQESQEARDERLASDSQRKAASRARETPSKRDERLALDLASKLSSSASKCVSRRSILSPQKRGAYTDPGPVNLLDTSSSSSDSDRSAQGGREGRTPDRSPASSPRPSRNVSPESSSSSSQTTKLKKKEIYRRYRARKEREANLRQIHPKSGKHKLQLRKRLHFRSADNFDKFQGEIQCVCGERIGYSLHEEHVLCAACHSKIRVPLNSDSLLAADSILSDLTRDYQDDLFTFAGGCSPPRQSVVVENSLFDPCPYDAEENAVVFLPPPQQTFSDFSDDDSLARPIADVHSRLGILNRYSDWSDADEDDGAGPSTILPLPSSPFLVDFHVDEHMSPSNVIQQAPPILRTFDDEPPPTSSQHAYADPSGRSSCSPAQQLPPPIYDPSLQPVIALTRINLNAVQFNVTNRDVLQPHVNVVPPHRAFFPGADYRSFRHLNLARLAVTRTFPATSHLGRMTEECEFCSALKFPHEKFDCCGEGKVDIPPLRPYPDALKDLYLGDSEASEHFNRNQKRYNSHFAMAAMDCELATPDERRGANRVFRIHGSIVHGSRPLHPSRGRNPLNNQLYIYDGAEAVRERMRVAPDDLNEDILTIIQDVFDHQNPFARAYYHFHEVEENEIADAAARGEQPTEVRMYLLESGRDDRRRNVPLHAQVALVFSVDAGGAPPEFHVVVKSRGTNNYRRLPRVSSNVDPMTYPILFPSGDAGWRPGVALRAGAGAGNRAQRNKLTMRMFYRYRLAMRTGFDPIFFSRLLTQQFLVDSWVKIERNDLEFQLQKQQTLYRDKYQGLWDHVRARQEREGDEDVPHGKVTVLPPSFPNSPRQMLHKFQDALTICTRVTKCDLFLTITFNPKWKEVRDELPAGIDAIHAPYLTARIFKQKLDEIKKDIWENGIFGRALCYVEVVEFQKRGYPHAHMLIGLADEDKLRSAEQIDSLICAEIPDPVSEPELHALVTSHMMHGPCGADDGNCPCMRAQKCSKQFPKPFSEHTVVAEEGYPSYRRRDNGRRVAKYTTRFGDDPVLLDNRHVVPYNRYLLKKYNCHVNVEAVTGFAVVKYLYKYLYKGYDCADVFIEGTLNHDEIKQYVDMRYVAAPEACWRIFEFSLHDMSHSVTLLALHLPNEQSVFYELGGEERALGRAQVTFTHLTAFFELNRRDARANDVLYLDVIKLYSFDRAVGWKRRRRNRFNVLARLPTVSPRDTERFHLSLLLLHVPGHTSFESLRTIGGAEHPTFVAACEALGLIENDDTWVATLEEANCRLLAKDLRRFFAYMLIFCHLNEPLRLWKSHVDDFTHDFVHPRPPRPPLSREDATTKALACVLTTLSAFGKHLEDYGLPFEGIHAYTDPPDRDAHRAEAERTRSSFNRDQTVAADAIIAALDESVDPLVAPTHRVFFVDGPGGHGKTYLYNYLVNFIRARGQRVKCCTWSGIASTLLIDGRTVCSTFSLPPPVIPGSSCNVDVASERAADLKGTHAFIVDEAPTTPSPAVHAIDAFLRQITGHDVEFGGKVFLFGGDFRQTLAIVPKGIGLTTMDYCIKRSNFWSVVRKFHLTQNMRVDPDSEEFTRYLLSVGNDTVARKQAAPFKNAIEVPREIVHEDDIVDVIFPRSLPADQYKHRVILTPRNFVALRINNNILHRIPGQVRTYYSADKAFGLLPGEEHLYPQDVLHSFTPNGLPEHALHLKVGAICMLLRNLDPANGLVNGTRVTVKEMWNRFLVVTINVGAKAGKEAFLPRLTLDSNDKSLPFTLYRTQFPVRLCYAMTIDKSQGQEFDMVGVYLTQSCFSHGQVYVAFSRAKSFSKLRVLVEEDHSQGKYDGRTYTQNVVLTQALL